MGKFVALILVAVSAYFVVVTEGKQFMDMSCYRGYIGEARALEIEKDCRETDSSGTECYKMCVLKTLGFVTSGFNGRGLYPAYGDALTENMNKLFSPEAQDVAEKLSRATHNCGETSVNLSEESPCGSSSGYYSTYNCLERALSCNWQYIDPKCHPGYIGEARALEIEKDCRQTDSSGTECYKMCVLKGLGFITFRRRDENTKILVLEFFYDLKNSVDKLFSAEDQDAADKFRLNMYRCYDSVANITDDMPCGSSDYYGLYSCLEEVLSC